MKLCYFCKEAWNIQGCIVWSGICHKLHDIVLGLSGNTQPQDLQQVAWKVKPSEVLD